MHIVEVNLSTNQRGNEVYSVVEVYAGKKQKRKTKMQHSCAWGGGKGLAKKGRQTANNQAVTVYFPDYHKFLWGVLSVACDEKDLWYHMWMHAPQASSAVLQWMCWRNITNILLYFAISRFFYKLSSLKQNLNFLYDKLLYTMTRDLLQTPAPIRTHLLINFFGGLIPLSLDCSSKTVKRAANSVQVKWRPFLTRAAWQRTMANRIHPVL